MLEIRLLGQFGLRREGETLSLPSRPAQSLLAYLVLNPGVSHRREQLGACSRLIHVRRARATRCGTRSGASAKHSELIPARDGTISLSTTLRWLSTRRRVTGLMRRSSPRGRPQMRPRSPLLPSLSVYAGDLLPAFYDDWVVLERERIETAFESRMRLWLERQVGAGCWDDVLEWGERWISLGHSPESAYCALMLAHAARGDASRVAATYQRCVDDLRNGLGVEPAEPTRRLYEQVIHGEGVPVFTQTQVLALPAAAQSPARALPASPGPPPFKGLAAFEVGDAPLFFGREALIARLVEHLRQSDLLIVVGASGSGKSSLVRAGLIPALMKGQRLNTRNAVAQNSQSWAYYILTPTGHPLYALALGAHEPGLSPPRRDPGR